MLQSGLLIPMHERSHAGIFSSIFIDIGDEQSIEDDLSTYSSLYGSLAATGKGHMTNVAITETLQPAAPVGIFWAPRLFLPFHPNGMKFVSLDSEGKETDVYKRQTLSNDTRCMPSVKEE